MIQPCAIEPAVIDDPREVTPAWLSAVLGTPRAPVDVTALAFERIGTGQTGACYRFHLRHGGGAPDTVILKIGAGTPQQRQAVRRGYAAEVLFYRSIAPHSPVQTPRCWHAALSPGQDAFTLVIADASPAVPGEQARGCTLAEARAALANLALLHGSTWNAPLLDGEAAWLRTTRERAARLAGLYGGAVETFVTRYAGHLGEEEAEAFRGAGRVMERWLLDSAGPQVLVHGDYRLDNLMFPPRAGDPVLAVDWQTLDIARPGRDVAYFIATAFDPGERRHVEDGLLAHYHAALVAGGVSGHDLAACHMEYRLGTLQAALVTVVGCALASAERTDKSDAMFLSMARRAAAAIRDLGTLDLPGQR